jgi:hypothetical protein
MSKKVTSTALEQRISTALADPQVTSTDLMELIDEAELAVTAAEDTVRAEHERALDPIVSPDAAKAKQSICGRIQPRQTACVFVSLLEAI